MSHAAECLWCKKPFKAGHAESRRFCCVGCEIDASEPADDTPAEREIKTVDLGTLKTVDVTPRDGHSMRALPHIDVHTLVRARRGARDSAFIECRRDCKGYRLERLWARVRAWFRRRLRGVFVGALMALVAVAVVVAFVYCWTRYWR